MSAVGPGAGQLWRELGLSMRMLRTAGGASLRQAERLSGRSRGTLSQIENGKVRPVRELVEWYDATFGGDGLLVSLFAEARLGHASHGPADPSRAADQDAGSVTAEVVAASPPAGQLAAPAADVEVSWTLRNAGNAPWHGLCLRRVGAPAAARLLRTPAVIEIPDIGAGETATVGCTVHTPAHAGTVVAYWQLAVGEARVPVASPLLAVTMVVR